MQSSLRSSEPSNVGAGSQAELFLELGFPSPEPLLQPLYYLISSNVVTISLFSLKFHLLSCCNFGCNPSVFVSCVPEITGFCYFLLRIYQEAFLCCCYLGIRPRSSHLLSPRPTMELPSQPQGSFLFVLLFVPSSFCFFDVISFLLSSKLEGFYGGVSPSLAFTLQVPVFPDLYFQFNVFFCKLFIYTRFLLSTEGR